MAIYSIKSIYFIFFFFSIRTKKKPARMDYSLFIHDITPKIIMVSIRNFHQV